MCERKKSITSTRSFEKIMKNSEINKTHFKWRFILFGISIHYLCTRQLLKSICWQPDSNQIKISECSANIQLFICIAVCTNIYQYKYFHMTRRKTRSEKN